MLVNLSDVLSLGLGYERLKAESSQQNVDIDIGVDTISATLVLEL